MEIKNKRMAIWGCGKAGDRMYIRYAEQVEFFVDRRANEISSYHGVPVVTYEGKKLDGFFLIIATDFKSYEDIRKLLEADGKAEGKDFIFHELITRKLLVLYGNCHMHPFMDYMRNCTLFSRDFMVFYVNVRAADGLFDFLRNADMLVMQDIRDENEFHAPGMSKVFRKFERSKVVLIPNLYGCNLFYPQLLLKQQNSLREIDHTEVMHHMVGIRDENIERAYKNNIPVSVVAKEIGGGRRRL